METTSAANAFASSEVLIAVFVGFIVGAIVVYLFGRKSAAPEDNPLQKPYEDLQAEYKAYREKVNSHFSKTATAVDNLAKSYQEVFDHLSEGAQQLMDGEALKIERTKRQGKAVTLAYLSNIEARQSSIPSPTPAKEAGESKPEPKSERVAPRPAEAAKPAAQPKSDKPANAANKTEPGISPVLKPAEAETAAKPAPAPAPTAEKVAAQSAPTADKPANPAAAAAKAGDAAAEKPETAPAVKEAAEKTSAQQAAANAGLTAAPKADAADPLSEVKRHIRENQDKK